MLGTAKVWSEKIRDAFIYAVVLVVLLFGAAVVAGGEDEELLRHIEDLQIQRNESAERTSVAAEINARLQASIVCVLTLPIETREKDSGDCYARQGLPYPFRYDDAAELLR